MAGVLSGICLLGLGGCATLSWYGQAARGQFELIAGREDIAELVADPATRPELVKRLRSIEELKTFARTRLHLDAGQAYRHYVDVDRDAVVWNVVATPRFDLAPEQWCYPVAGCVSYRGYFRRQPAVNQARRLALQGLDTAVTPAAAYSTLGWLDDPVLSTMLRDGDTGLAATLFHELAHRTVYVPGDTAFNEAYATFVEQEGMRRWLADAPETLRRWQREQALADAFNRLFLDARTELAELYRRDLPSAAMQAEKRAVFRRLRARAARLAGLWDDRRYLAWLEGPLNNTHLALAAAYRSGLPAMAGLLADCDDDLACFHAEIQRLASADAAVRTRFLEARN